MFVTIVQVQVKPEYVQQFIYASEANHRASVLEPGNLRFDVLQQQTDPACFVLYEAYTTEAAAQAHKLTAHYRLWRDTVADWMAQPRQGLVYQGHFPEHRE